jgi:hypothetical protein
MYWPEPKVFATFFGEVNAQGRLAKSLYAHTCTGNLAALKIWFGPIHSRPREAPTKGYPQKIADFGDVWA